MYNLPVIILILITVFISYKGFNNHTFFDSYKFEVDKILIQKDYIRLISNGFLHANWKHLMLNMFSLYAFSGSLQFVLGVPYFFVIYLGSLMGGNLFSLYIHRNHGDYSSIGASGAVCGVIFATIAVYPGMGVGIFGIPFSIPGWLYAILYIGYTIYGIKSKSDNIGHEAHLGGALTGMIISIIIFPESLKFNYIPILAAFVPTIIFLYLIITRPIILLLDGFRPIKKYENIDHIYNENKLKNQKELDLILDKISRKGMESLSKKEKQRLDELSKS